MKIFKSMKLIDKYENCPECDNNLIGNGQGGIIVEDDTFRRFCKCGFDITVNENDEKIGYIKMGLKLKNLEICFKAAKKDNAKYIATKVWMYGFEECEVIINPIKNFEKKLEYYKLAYNDDLTLKNAPDKIKIIGFSYGNSFEEIEEDLSY